jgi:RHS repeat-associated protein
MITPASMVTMADAGEFTSKERDAETGLDYFGARYMSSAQGRFTSPDPMMASAHVANPQSWNRYTYTLNNPLRYFDPDGLNEISVGDCQRDTDCTVVRANVIYDRNAHQGQGLTNKEKQRFQNTLLSEAKSDLGNAKIALDVQYTAGAVTRNGDSPPSISGLDSQRINFVTTDLIPVGITGNAAASGALNGLSQVVNSGGQNALVSWIAMDNAIGFRIPFFQTNTVTHETIHNLLGDPMRSNPGGIGEQFRELGIERRSTILHMGGSQQDVQRGAKTFTLPPNPRLNQPRTQ